MEASVRIFGDEVTHLECDLVIYAYNCILERERITRLSGKEIADVMSTLVFFAKMIAERLSKDAPV